MWLLFRLLYIYKYKSIVATALVTEIDLKIATDYGSVAMLWWWWPEMYRWLEDNNILRLVAELATERIFSKNDWETKFLIYYKS